MADGQIHIIKAQSDSGKISLISTLILCTMHRPIHTTHRKILRTVHLYLLSLYRLDFVLWMLYEWRWVIVFFSYTQPIHSAFSTQ